MWFNADRVSGDAHWVLPPELWPAEIRRLREQADSEPNVVVRILVISADEGGEILKAFFLAHHCKLRVFYVRDPPHRLSNMFNAGLRGGRPPS